MIQADDNSSNCHDEQKMQEHIEWLKSQNYELQSQLQLYEELKQGGSIKKMKQTISHLQDEVKALKLQNKNLQIDLAKTSSQCQDRSHSSLQQEVLKLKNQVKSLKQSQNISSPVKSLSSSRIKQTLNPSAILSKTLDNSKSITSLLFITTQSNFHSPYLEISKGKYENVKLIKQLKQGFEQSYFNQYHFDSINYDLPQTLIQIDRQNQISQGRGLLVSNQIALIFGQSQTKKKHFMVQYLDTFALQLRQQYDTYLTNDEYMAIQAKVTYKEFLNSQQKNVQDTIIYITKENTLPENDRILRDGELVISKIKLMILNRMKLSQSKEGGNEYTKVRQLLFAIERIYSSETQTNLTAIYTSNHNFKHKNYQVAEQGINDLLQIQDNGKQITEQLELPQLTIQLILCVHPTVINYPQSVNTFQLYQLVQTLKFSSNKPVNSDKYSNVLEQQNAELKVMLQTQKQKLKHSQWEAYKAKQQLQIAIQHNDDSCNKNLKLREAYKTLLTQIQQLQTQLAQQISAKKASDTKAPALNVRTLEKAQKSLANLLQKHSAIDATVSPLKMNRTQDQIKPTSSGESDDEYDIVDADEPSEIQSEPEEQHEGQPRKESSISMI